MRVMVLVKATTDSENDSIPKDQMDQMLKVMAAFNDELVAAGITKPGDCNGLRPSSEGKRVGFDGTDRTVIDGPFDGTGSLVAGYWLWNVKDMDDAVAWVKRCPNPMPGYSAIEIRPVNTVA